MNRSRRLLIALCLLLTMPLRAFAASTMPCCPVEPSHAMAAMDEGASMAVTDAHGPPADDAHRPDAVVCCIAAMIASSTPMIAIPLLPIARASDVRYDAVGPFVTDAPDRPPRPPLASA